MPKKIASDHWMVVMRGADDHYYPIKGSSLGRMFVFDLKSEALAAMRILREKDSTPKLFQVVKIHVEAVKPPTSD